MRQLVALIRVGGDTKRISIDEGPAADGSWRRVRYQREGDGSVTVLVDHVNQRGEVVETFRPARWSSDQLVDIKIVDV